MMAEKPGPPTQLTRVDMNSLAAGEIRIHWELPSDQGATPVIGYKIYLNSELNFDASTDATINSYTYTGLNVGQIYTLGVTALNFKGESILATISKLSASIPAKMPPLIFQSSTETQVVLKVNPSSFNGGDPITQYAYRRDLGPATDF